MNARKEFLKHTAGRSIIKAWFRMDQIGMINDKTKYVQYWVKYDQNSQLHWDISGLLMMLDFEYDERSGLQLFWGAIIYEDGSWSERHIVDGAECWLRIEPPKYPESCI